ncbi:MAG TPA: phytanoyl-CoA dioxygenase family protein [Roseiflexaceae bacterium]|nr:phytanoyl-CoA dioxygenase family protein [Roseiflexaceae bacterium]
MFGEQDLARYEQDGYAVARELFTEEEVQFFVAHYMDMSQRENASQNQSLNDVSSVGANENDPLKKWPRLLQMHRRDEPSLRWLLDARLNACLTALLGREPYAVQTMLYFKPAGARGQALHQDQYYLRVQPGTCMAAWLALDDCDEENGCLYVAPGSHTWPLLCTVPADISASFTDITVELPEDQQPIPVVLKAGDVLFFNGQLVHGSYPNTSANRFRRSLIGHYIVGDAQAVYQWYHPALRMDGSPVTLETSDVGGTCGTWVDREGSQVLEIEGERINEQIFGPH